MDDILERLGVLEASVSEIRAQVRAIAAIEPHLATKADMCDLEAKIIKRVIATVMANTGQTMR